MFSKKKTSSKKDSFPSKGAKKKLGFSPKRKTGKPNSKKKPFFSKKKFTKEQNSYVTTKQTISKPKLKLRIKPNAIEKAAELIQETKRNLLNSLQEVDSPFVTTVDSTENLDKPIRINRYLARCGLGSRRDVETLIKEGKIFVNGEVETNLSRKIDPQKDVLTYEGTHIKPLEKDIVLVFNKPAGYLCSHFDVHHEKTVFQLLPPQFRRMNMAGRLDLNSRGLLIFTTDGNLIQELAHPSFGVTKVYHVVLDELPSESELVNAFLTGVEEGGELLRAKAVRVLDREKKLVEVVLKEGRKRQIHRMFKVLGRQVLDLQRVQIGHLKLQDLNLKEGEFKLISKNEILGEKN